VDGDELRRIPAQVGVRNVTNGREVARGTAANKAAMQTAVDAAYTTAVNANSEGAVQYPVEVPAFDAP
jgi:hypothetical protein